MRRAAFGLVTLAISLLAGCGGAIATDLSGGNDAGSDVTPASPSAGGRCTTNADCTSTQYCDHAGTCGTSGTHGTCKARPETCPDIELPVCGCDGQSYTNSCGAYTKGIDVSDSESCSAPKTGSFFCGTAGKTCDAATTYCQRTYNDVGGPGQPSEFDECLPLPASCKTDTACACFPPNTPCLSYPKACSEIPIPNTRTYGLQIICPGG
jgi:hypothetical protein